MIYELKATKSALGHLAESHPDIHPVHVLQALRDDYACTRKAPQGRKVVLGEDDGGRLLMVVGLLKGKELWLITCREMNKNEKAYYRAMRKKRMGY